MLKSYLSITYIPAIYSYANFPGIYASRPTNVNSNAKATALSCDKTLRIEMSILPTKREPIQTAPKPHNTWKIIHIFWQSSYPQAPSVADTSPSLISISSGFAPHVQSPKIRWPFITSSELHPAWQGLKNVFVLFFGQTGVNRRSESHMQLREQYGSESLSVYVAANLLWEHSMKIKPTNSKHTIKAVIKFHATIFLKINRNFFDGVKNIKVNYYICWFDSVYLGVGVAFAMINPPIKTARPTTTGWISFDNVRDVHSLFRILESSAGIKNLACK